MSPGPWQIIIIVVLILLIFGRGRISEMMGDLGKGIKSFKTAVTEEDKPSAKNAETPPKQIEASPPPPATPAPTSEPAKADDGTNGASQ